MTGDPGEQTAAASFRRAAHLMATLADCGVRHCVVSAGARCAPLVFAAAHQPGIHLWTHFDERSAAFRALGIGKALRGPAVLICTSGTAGANYYPAVIEARMSRTPLLILTADRPPRLRDRGAPQTINQLNLYGDFAVHSCDLADPDNCDNGLATWEEETRRAMVAACRGPVHLNVPFDEPLVPAPEMIPTILDSLPKLTMPKGKTVSEQNSASPSDDTIWNDIASKLQAAARVLIVCGPQNDHDDLREHVSALAGKLRCPVVADIASQIRFGQGAEETVCAHYDLYLRKAPCSLEPDIVLRLGGLPTSKYVNEWLASLTDLPHIVIDDHPRPADPYISATRTITSDLALACETLLQRLPARHEIDTRYRNEWRKTETATLARIAEAQVGPALFDGEVAAAAYALAPRDTVFYLSNSLPIRMADTFARSRNARLRTIVNRGANGIDGLISSAAGAASVLDRPVVLLIGDIAFLHDINGLWGLERDTLPLKIILINNNGGGIFSLLPLARHTAQFEELIAMPHGTELSHAARLYGVPHHRCDSMDDFRTRYTACFESPGPEIIEIVTDRAETSSMLRNLVKQVATAVGAGT